jgi:hypothetical protein
MRNLPAVVEDSAADRERLKSILRLAQSSGDRYHVTALRLVLKRFDERTRAARHRPRQVSAQLEPKPPHRREGTRHANA